mgnify:FL=1
MPLPIHVRPDASTPIYLQIRYQLAYLITSGQLAEGDKLPPVRAVADQLGVNPGTVAQAYREMHEQGLVDAAPGRGTFVASNAPADLDRAARSRLLDEAVERALHRGRALGFGEAELRQRLEVLLHAVPASRAVLFAGPTAAIARKYATSLERRLGPTLSAHPVTFDELRRRDAHVASLLDIAYFVVTFAGFVRSVEADLAGFARPSRVLGCGTSVQPRTIEELRRLGPTDRVCLVTTEPYVDQSLHLIETHAGLAPGDVAVCLDGDAATLRDLLPRVERVVYTFAARDFLNEQEVPGGLRLEIAYDVSSESLRRLRAWLLPDEPAFAAAMPVALGDAG